MKVQFDEMTQTFPPEMPPEIPLIPPAEYRSITVPVPMVYEKAPAAKVEYRVLTLEAPQADELAATLNAAGREGWWLVQILAQEKPMWLVLMRQQLN